MTEAERKMAMEWFAKEHPNSNKFADEDGPKSRWWHQRETSLSDFAAGLRAGREWSAGLVAFLDCTDRGDNLAAAIRKGPQ